MKRIYKLLPILFIGIVLTISCEKNKTELEYTDSDFIAFIDTLVSVEETATQTIEIVVMTTKSEQAATVDITVESPDGSAVAGTHYNLVYPTDGKLNFAAGEYTDTIKVTVVDNGDEDGAKIIEFTIGSGPSDVNIGLPGPDNKQTKCQLAISDNDCAFIPTDLNKPISGIESLSWLGTFATAAELNLVDTIDNSIYVFEVTGIMQSPYDGWDEDIQEAPHGNGGIALLYFDFSDPIEPEFYFEEGNYAITYGNEDDTYWVYDIYNNPDKPSLFSTCDNTIVLNGFLRIYIEGAGDDAALDPWSIEGEFLFE